MNHIQINIFLRFLNNCSQEDKNVNTPPKKQKQKKTITQRDILFIYF